MKPLFYNLQTIFNSSGIIKMFNLTMNLKRAYILCVPAIMAGLCHAKPPERLNIGQFNNLIQSSPFTVKPVRKQAEEETPLARDWTLAGISPNDDGFSVTIMNKNNRQQRIRFIPGFDTGDFKLLAVEQDTASRNDSRVHIQKGSQKAWIGYDEEVVKTRTVARSRAGVNNGGSTANITSGRPVRRGLPPVPGQNTRANNNNNSQNTNGSNNATNNGDPTSSSSPARRPRVRRVPLRRTR